MPFSPVRRLSPGLVLLSAAASTLPVIGARAAEPAAAPEAPPDYAPVELPGKGLAQHPFLFAGEWDFRKPDQTIFMVRGGQVVWTYSIPIKLPDGTLQEWGDATVLSDGNILFSRKTGAGIVGPDRKLIWNFDAPPGTEIHVAQPRPGDAR